MAEIEDQHNAVLAAMLLAREERRNQRNPRRWWVKPWIEWRLLSGHCCGAIDGKHVKIRAPKKNGTTHFNYKGFFSIVLLAVVDGNYRFIWADVGAEGSASDAGIFNAGPLRGDLENNRMGFPDPEPLPGDDAFPLRTWMMKLYGHRGLDHTERIFNYRTSRARRVVENAFGILGHRWRVLLTTIQLSPRRTRKVTSCCLILHNLMRERYPGLQANDVDQEDGQGNVIDGAWRQHAMLEANEVGGPQVTREGKQQRVYLKNYYNSEDGRLEWQDAIV